MKYYYLGCDDNFIIENELEKNCNNFLKQENAYTKAKEILEKCFKEHPNSFASINLTKLVSLHKELQYQYPSAELKVRKHEIVEYKDSKDFCNCVMLRVWPDIRFYKAIHTIEKTIVDGKEFSRTTTEKKYLSEWHTPQIKLWDYWGSGKIEDAFKMTAISINETTINFADG